jgi:hypothetical protein
LQPDDGATGWHLPLTQVWLFAQSSLQPDAGDWHFPPLQVCPDLQSLSVLHDFFRNIKKYTAVPIPPATSKNKHMYRKMFL